MNHTFLTYTPEMQADARRVMAQAFINRADKTAQEAIEGRDELPEWERSSQRRSFPNG